MTTLLAGTDSLTAADRCDRCGAQAYVRVVLVKGDLLFCAHHGHEHETKLREVAREFHDETARLAATPSRAVNES